MFFENDNKMMMTNNDMENMNDFEQNYKTKGKYYFVWFYAKWCGHCTGMCETWNKFTKMVNSKPLGIKVLKIESQHIESHHNVSGFPTLRLYKDGKIIEYTGDREPEAFYKFLEEHKPKQVKGKSKKSKRKSSKSKKSLKGGKSKKSLKKSLKKSKK